MKIQDLFTPTAETASPDAPLSEAARRMKEKEIGFLPVMNPMTGGLDGVLTDRDICMSALKQDRPLSEIHVRDAMTRTVRTCTTDSDLHKVHALMREHQIRRLPVTDGGGRLVGVLSLDDIARGSSKSLLSHAGLDVAKTLDQVGHSHLAT